MFVISKKQNCVFKKCSWFLENVQEILKYHSFKKYSWFQKQISYSKNVHEFLENVNKIVEYVDEFL